MVPGTMAAHSENYPFQEIVSQWARGPGAPGNEQRLLEILLEAFWRGDFPSDVLGFDTERALRQMYSAEQLNESGALAPSEKLNPTTV